LGRGRKGILGIEGKSMGKERRGIEPEDDWDRREGNDGRGEEQKKRRV